VKPIPVATKLALENAYAECRAIAKREAKNFYYAFVALPEPRRNAICAIYAFMRMADDLADDESLPREERRRRLDGWTIGAASATAVTLPIRFLLQCAMLWNATAFRSACWKS